MTYFASDSAPRRLEEFPGITVPAIALTSAAIARSVTFRRELAGGQVLPEDGSFDDTTLLYDVLHSADGRHIMLLGPPLIGVETWFRTLIETVAPAGGKIRWFQNDRHGRAWIPGQADELTFADVALEPRTLTVQPNLSYLFDGLRVAVTLQKDNDLAWIADWARFYADRHGATGVLVYDNGSSRYRSEQLRQILAQIPGLLRSVVVDWPYPYGVTGVTNFCQAVMLEHARRRFLASARSVVNADIDELAVFDCDASIFDTVEKSETGYVQAPGIYLSNATQADPARRRHKDFTEFEVGAHLSPPKWAVVPGRCPEDAAWRPHFIAGMAASQAPAGLRFRHFKGINTNWLEPRWQAGVLPVAGDAIDAAWAAQCRLIDWSDVPHV